MYNPHPYTSSNGDLQEQTLQTEAGKNAATKPRLRHVSGRAASADAQWLRPFRPPGPEVWMTSGVLYKLYSMFNMMDDGLLLNVFDVWCVAMLLASTMIISVL